MMGKSSFWAIVLAVLLCALLISCDNSESSSSSQEESESEAIFYTDASCSIDILKIGKADCIVISTGSEVIMIDTGERENFKQIKSYMSDKGYNRIDTLILTHPDKDHIGAASEVLLNYDVGTVIESSYNPSEEEYLLYHSTMSELGIEPTIIYENYSFISDGCEILVDAPRKWKYKDKQSNNSSLVVSIRCGEKRLLFCGDAMELRLEELIDAQIGEYDFVKLPYHGNYLENYRGFFEMTLPKHCAITCSSKNPASQLTLDMCAEFGASVYQTRDGEINISVSNDKIDITQK